MMSWLPNIITCLRILLLGPTLWLLLNGYFEWALYMFAFAGLSDGIDGFLARQFNWTSRFGAFMDPLADKLLVMGSFICLVILDVIPVWAAWIVITRDLTIMFGVSFLYYWYGGIEMTPSRLSKLNTAIQVLWIFLEILQLSYPMFPDQVIVWVMYVAVTTTIASAIGYIMLWVKKHVAINLAGRLGMPNLQMALPISIKPTVTLDSFFIPADDESVSSFLYQIKTQAHGFFYLWGEEGVGKTHLLTGLVNDALANGRQAYYLDALAILDLSPELMDGLEAVDLICIDNVQAMVEQASWQQALFHFYNRAQAAGRTVVFSSNAPIHSMPIELKDLHSRLTACFHYQIPMLSDESKQLVLMRRASALGLILAPNVCQYIMTHHGRGMKSLQQLLDLLDKASLAAQRKLTIPFIKQILSEMSHECENNE